MTKQLAQDNIGVEIATSFRPEAQLLLNCARTHIDPATAKQIQNLLQKDLDWHYLLRHAYRHGVIPLLYWSLQKTYPEAVPQNILRQLQFYFQIKADRNLFLTKELLLILDLFATHNISAIPFKGAVFAASVYGNLALREFCDLDILVHKQDFLKAKELLIRQGYQHKCFGEHEAAYAQAQLIRIDGNVGIDLHYGITPSDFFFSLDPEPFWQCLKPISFTGTTVAILSPEDSLLVAYVQGSKEGWAYLKRICDMAELIRAHPDINWKQVMEQVSFLGSEQSFFLGLLLASHHLGTLLPKEVYQKINNLPKLNFLCLELYKQLFSEADFVENTLNIGGLSFISIYSMDNFQERVRHCYHIAMNINEKDRAILPLPNFLSFLYYLLRLLRLVRTYNLSTEKMGLLWKFITG